MNSFELNKFKKSELINIAKELNINSTGAKSVLINNILDSERENIVIKEQLGLPGKDAVTYRVKLKNKFFAMKQFKKRKSSNKLICESEFQKRASKLGISPKIISVNDKHKYIIMEKMDSHLIDIKKEKYISIDHQKQLIKIYKKLDDEGIFHADANPLNYMLKGNKLFIIDFGMSKEISESLMKKLNTTRPNLRIMTLGMILKLKSMNYPVESYSYLLKYIPGELKDSLKL